MTTALRPTEGVNVETGEIVNLPAKFEMRDYLSQLASSEGMKAQQQLAAAYDQACRSLIGPNDVQREGKREFKKKSAWRKLARYFGISVDVVRVDREVLSNSQFLATVVARARAPWGQAYEEVGACCTDEATGRRTITVADAIATASTRASNRAVSNLIAMGEVSAEEIGGRHAEPEEETPTAPEPEPTSETPWPGPGATNGKLLNQWSTKGLEWLTRQTKGEHIEIWTQLAHDELKRRAAVSEGSAK